MGAEKFLIVTGDGFVRMYGQGERGAGHALLIPAGFQGDPLCSSARITRACGSTLESAKAVEKFLGEKRCQKCAAWLETADGTAAIEAARAERWTWEFGGEAVTEAVRASAEGADTREDSAPVGSASGVSEAEMRDAVAAFYANGGKVPTEVAALPDPAAVRPNWAGSAGASEESTPWCDFRRGAPVEGSDADGIEGKCPECRGVVALSDKGEIPKHRRYGVTVSAGPGANRVRLSSASLAAVEHGSVPGSPAAADKRRAAESRCDRSGRVVRNSTGGKKKCTGCARTVDLVKRERTVRGETVTQWVYPDHVSAADTFRHVGGGDVRKVTPRGSGADAGKGAREHGSVNGSANTGSVNLPPVQPQRGWLAVAGTGVLSMSVRPGVDGGVAGKYCPVCRKRVDIAHRGMSRTARRRHSREVAAYERGRTAERDAKREREIREGARLPQGARKAARKAASIGSFSEGTNGSTGTVAHGGKRPAVAPKVTPRGETRKGEAAASK